METEPETRTLSSRVKRTAGFIAGLGVATLIVNQAPFLESPVIAAAGVGAVIVGATVATVITISEGIPTVSEEIS